MKKKKKTKKGKPKRELSRYNHTQNSYQGQERRNAYLDNGGVCTFCVLNDQASRCQGQPSPSGSESRVACSFKLRSESSIGTERTVDQVSNCTGGLAAATGLHALPVEGVVPDLSGVVEQTDVIGVLGGWMHLK